MSKYRLLNVHDQDGEEKSEKSEKSEKKEKKEKKEKVRRYSAKAKVTVSLFHVFVLLFVRSVYLEKLLIPQFGPLVICAMSLSCTVLDLRLPPVPLAPMNRKTRRRTRSLLPPPASQMRHLFSIVPRQEKGRTKTMTGATQISLRPLLPSERQSSVRRIQLLRRATHRARM